MISNLWAPEQADPSSVAIMRAGADELDAIEELMGIVRQQAWPHKADDSYGLLAIHERMLGIPIKPFGVPLSQRQDAAKSAVQSRRVGSASQWVSRFDALMRGNPWTYQRNHPGRGQLTITIPYGEESYSAGQVRALAERVTPAHLELIVRYDVGWIAGVSRAGLDAV
jgi:hypothetical protein